MILYNYSKGNERNPKMKGKIVMKNMVQVCEMVLEMMIKKYNTEWYNIIEGQYNAEFENTVSKLSGVSNIWNNKSFVQWFNEMSEEV